MSKVTQVAHAGRACINVSDSIRTAHSPANAAAFALQALAFCSPLAFTSMAHAQAASDGEISLEEVVITGSRVITNGNNSPTPVTMVSTEQLLTTAPSTVIQALTQMPAFAGGRSPTTNPGNSSQNNAARNLALRNLTSIRTLVMIDGRRVPGTTPRGEVNADLIPSMLLQRVDVVTGGASAVYGSDAVAGVVNFITDRNFNGLKFDAQYGVSQLGDGQETKLAFAGGMDLFDGRGHIEGSYEYFNAPGIFDKLSREWGRQTWSVQGNGRTTPYKLVQNTRLVETSFLGVIPGNGTRNTGNPLRGMVFSSNGVLTPFRRGLPTGSATIDNGGDGGYFYNASLEGLYQSDLGFGRFDFDITDNLHFFTTVQYMKAHNKNNHETNEFRLINIARDNAFLSPTYQAQLQAANINSFQFSKMITQAIAKQPESFTDGTWATLGLEGTLGNWRWDASYFVSRNKELVRNNANPQNERSFAAIDSVTVTAANVGSSGLPIGSIQCRVLLTSSASRFPGCVPLNLFGPTSESQAALNYVLGVSSFDTKTGMDSFTGSIAGPLFANWAGDVNVALSGEWRKLTYQLDTDVGDNKANCTGLAGAGSGVVGTSNCTQGTTFLWQSNVLLASPEVSQSVKEVAAEVDFPLLKDVALVQSLNLNAAVRLTDYDTAKEKATTWKVGLDWNINDQLKIRSTRSHDIRAPNLNDLFAPRLTNPAGIVDYYPTFRPTSLGGPLPQANYQAPFNTDPNPNLDPEAAENWTAGIVYRPDWLPNFSVALDGYWIKIDNAITTIQGQNQQIQSLCYASGGSSPYCALIQRTIPLVAGQTLTAANFDASLNPVLNFYSQPQNAQKVETYGLDLELNYTTPAFGGDFSFRGLVGYQPHITTQQFEGATILDDAGTNSAAKVRVAAFLKYKYEDFSVDVLQRWIGYREWNSDRSLLYAEPDLPSTAYTALTLSYQLSKVNIFLNITNLFDKQPTPYGAVGGASSVPGLFGGFIQGEDTIGRFFTLGFRMKL
jgi:iron complex outermembrane recepter protein